MGRLLGSILRISILLYLGIFVAGYFYSDKIIFQPQSSFYKDSDEIIKINVGPDETVSAIYLKNPDASYTVLFSHGNAENIGSDRRLIERIRSMGFSVLAYDYRGYGTSSGKASESNSYQDADAAYNYLVNDLHTDPKKIIDWGRSLGGGIAVDLASKRPVGGLIVESSFVSAFRVMTHIPIFPLDKFDSISKIRDVHCPVLIIHGTKDQVIPFWHGERLFQGADEPKTSFWVDGAGHNDLPSIAGPGYENAVKAFVDSIETR